MEKLSNLILKLSVNKGKEKFWNVVVKVLLAKGHKKLVWTVNFKKF